MTRNTESLPQLATKIHALERKTIASTIEIGRLLQVAFDRFEHGDRTEYHEWIEKEFAWSERTARHYRDLYEFQNGNSCQFEKLNITLTALYFLAELSKAGGDVTDDLWVSDVWAKEAMGEVFGEAKKRRITRATAVDILVSRGDRLEAEEKAAAAADEPEPEPDVEPEVDADEPDAEPEVDADEPDELPPHNELSDALEIIHAHGMYSPLWVRQPS